MDSLPIEFQSHHLPLLFFAGLPSPPPPNSPDSTRAPNPSPTDPFQALSASLRRAITANQPGLQVWSPARPNQNPHEFRVVVVDKAVRFPPRKARPDSSANSINHSPLSPLSPNSPLYPDGIMTPIWIRKHRDMIPAAFLLTLHLWEPPSSQRTNDNSGNGIRFNEKPDPEELKQQKDQDHGLIYDIIDRKKTTTERGIKLVVVILTSRTMIDNPDLDARLAYIRRQSGLDSRASLFVLSPVIDQEIIAFTTTLKTELYESCIDYYREHSRKVRRKRSRNNSTAALQSTVYSKPGQPVVTPLGSQGWAVRADYKLAVFAEFRQEYEVALKSYEDCWEGLSIMFGSTAILPPRTKRWAEAKVLIDCVNMKICRFHLYNQDTLRSMDQFRKHITRFKDLGNGWGIGEETFELWSWLSKQYNMLADLVDMGCRHGMRLPSLLPVPDTATQNAVKRQSQASDGLTGASNGSILVPVNVLLHAGFYYYQSGVCAIHRRDKFQASEIAEAEMRSITKSKDASTVFQGSAALTYERKIDHAELIIGLFTKAYELFKRFESNRMTLFLAYKIALIYQDRKHWETANNFFDRITSSYRKDNFGPVVQTALLKYRDTIKIEVWSYQNSFRPKFEQLEQLLKLGFELLGHDRSIIDSETKQDIYDDLPLLLHMTGGLSSEPTRLITLDMTSSSSPLRSQVVFWQSSIELGGTVDFQITIFQHDPIPERELSFKSIELHFTNFPPILFDQIRSDSVGLQSGLETYDISVSSLIFERDLTWTYANPKMIFNGRFKPLVVGKIKLDQVKFILNPNHGSWRFELNTKIISAQQAEESSRWVRRLDREAGETVTVSTEALSSSCQVRHKAALARVEIEAEGFSLAQEKVGIKIRLFNDEESEAVIFKLNASSRDPPAAKDVMTIDGHGSTDQLKAVDLGSVKAQESIERILWLQAFFPGIRKINLNISAHMQSETEPDVPYDLSHEENQSLLTSSWKMKKFVTLDVKDAFTCRFDARYLNRIRDRTPRKLLDFDPPGVWDDCEKVVVNVTIVSHSPVPLSIEKVEMDCENASTPMRVFSTSLNSSSDEPWVLEAESAFSISYIAELANGSESDMISGCEFKTTWSRASPVDSAHSSHISRHPFQFPSPPYRATTVTTDLPHHLQLYERCKISYMIKNFSSRQVAELSFQLHPTDQWVYSGPRKLEKIKILPRGSRTIAIDGLPVMLGEIEAPHVQIFERLRTRKSSFLDDEVDAGVDENENQGRAGGTKELVIVRESGAVRAEGGVSKTPSKSSLKVMVLPS